MTTILIVDDDPHIRELLRHFLSADGYAVMEAEDGEDALRQLELKRAELAVLDVMMPRMDGLELCALLRSHYDMPVLMLTAKGDTADKLKGFELGADDYLVKPFEPAELTARIRALLKRYRIAAEQIVSAGRLTMNRRTYGAELDGKPLALPLKEYELLFKLASYPGRTLSRDALIEDVWGYGFEGNERTLDVHINRLRERFPEAAGGFRIATMRGLGYRLEVL